MNRPQPTDWASVQEFEAAVRKIFSFLVNDYGFTGPRAEQWVNREINLTYEHPDRSVAISYEVPGGIGTGMHQRVHGGPEKPGLNLKTIYELMREHEPELYKEHKSAFVTKQNVEKLLNEQAQVLRRYAGDFLSGGPLI
jgi:hypothetical protein